MIRFKARAAWLIAMAVQALTAAVSAKALAHLWTTAEYGPICGAGADHCWACYAAPALIAASAVVTYRAWTTTRRPALAATI